MIPNNTMSTPISLHIDLTKIPRSAIYIGKKGKYITLIVWENRNGEDQYGNTHSVQISQTKEQREAGEKKVYVGNGKWMAARPMPSQQPVPQQQTQDAEHDDIPF